MEDTVEEVLFETLRHASGPYFSNYPPQQPLIEGRGGRLISYLPFRGIMQVKENFGDILIRGTRHALALGGLEIYPGKKTANHDDIPNDSITKHASASCFVRVSAMANLVSHVESLIALLGEWEGLFVNEDDNVAKVELTHSTANNWNNYEWDEGWGSFQESDEKRQIKLKQPSLSILCICVGQ